MRAAAIPVLVLVLLLGSCAGAEPFEAPERLDGGSLVRVDRAEENALMAEASAGLERQGLQEPFGAAYDYDIDPDKPVFFLGAGRGTAEAAQLMIAALPLFGGERGPTDTPANHRVDDLDFLCAPYRHTGVPGTEGTGDLASIAAVCAWFDGETAGFGVGVAGPDVQQVLVWTVEAQRGLDG